MRVFLRICVVFLWVVLLVVDVSRGEDGEAVAVDDDLDPAVRVDDEQRKDGKQLTSGSRRPPPAPVSTNGTRDSQLLSVLAARRRQLLNGRLATHISTLASIANKNKNNATFIQLEVRDSTNSIVKKITFDNSTNEAIAPSLKITTTDGNKEIKQEVKPHEIRHLFVPKVYQDSRTRAGFINNRRRNNSQENATDSNGAVYVPPEKLDGLDKELVIDPEEEFQVDESSHGVFLLNYTDTDNITRSLEANKTVITNETKETTTTTTKKPESMPIVILEPEIETTVAPEISNSTKAVNVISNVTTTEGSTTLIKVDTEKDKTNTTLFMSDELYNHFHPLETELQDEDMAPFIYFGQKLGGPAINDNLTNAPSLSASTKSANSINSEKRKYNSRYSATEKYKNSSVNEEEVNEDMDVSVVKNIIEKNKVRNTVKGPAPARHVGLVNAYRKPSTSTATPKSLSAAELNTTEPIVSVTPGTDDRTKESNRTSNVPKDHLIRNATLSTNITESNTNRTQRLSAVTSTTPQPYTRNYLNLRRRPAKITATPSPEPLASVNTTTEKASTLVYTAVVTSVSITSSVKGHNKTESEKETEKNPPEEVNAQKETPKPVTLNETEISQAPYFTQKPQRQRVRIRTTTPNNIASSRATDAPVPKELSTKVSPDLKTEATSSKLPERLANLYRINEDTNSSTVRPKNILRRRRPTTSTTTSTTEAVTHVYSPRYYTIYDTIPTLEPSSTTTMKAEQVETTENTIVPFIVTSRTSSESSSKPFYIPTNTNLLTSSLNTTFLNKTQDNSTDLRNEEVLIEAEKTYTASYVLAGLGFLPVAAIVAFVLRSLLNKKTKEIDTEYEGYFDDNEIKKESPITPVARAPIATPVKPDKKWEFPRSKLRLQTLLGQGNFGQVWKAEADDLSGHDGLTRLVAVKSIKESASQKEKQELLHEIYIMQKIGTHPNVVTLLACCTEQEPYLLIMEYVMCGKLLTYLRERRARPDRFTGSGGGSGLTSRDLTVFAYCVARGMDYITSKGIVHRDLAARNILVDHNKLCKIADFGLSRADSAAERAPQRHALPVRWMAPEALLYNVYNHETDVWAYGILLWEIVTLGSTPYASMSGREVVSAVSSGYRLERPAHCAPALYRAMHACWHQDPTQRPSFADLKATLAQLLDNEPAEGNYVDLDSFYQESSVYSDPSAIINDEEGLSAEYDRERRCFRELSSGPKKYQENRAFSFRDEELRNKFSLGGGGQRMGGFGIRDVPFNDRNFSDGDFENTFNDRSFNEKSFSDRQFSDKSFNAFDPSFGERKDGKLSTSSFHRERERERERENPIVSRNSFSGFPRLGTRDGHFQLISDGRNKRVSEFECDI